MIFFLDFHETSRLSFVKFPKPHYPNHHHRLPFQAHLPNSATAKLATIAASLFSADSRKMAKPE
jgi:hypothetical protein